MDWTTGVAGNFTLRAKVKAGETWFYSEEKTATVLFPTRSQILSDAGVVSAMDSEWQQTLIDSTPTQYRERGLIVYLNTTVTPNAYEADDYDTSQWVAPGDDIIWFWDALNEPDPFANASGTRYPVGRFHTHTPEEFAHANFLGRNTGPLGQDEPTANAEKTPGFV